MLDSKIMTLLTLVDCGNYTKAAKKLHLTQPAITYQIHQIEDDFNIKLFHKNKKGLLLTTEGEILVKYARRAMAIQKNCLEALEDSKTNVRHFVIAATPTAGEDIVPQMLAEFCHRHPKTHIHLLMDTIRNIQKLLKQYEADIAIIDGRMSSAKYQSVLLDTDYLCLIVSPKHHLAQNASVSLADLKQEKFILRSKGAGTRTIFENYLATNLENIKNYNIMIETDNLATIRELVAENMGVSILSHSICVEDEKKGRLKLIPLENSTMIREINMVHSKDFNHPEILQELQQIYQQIKN